MLELINTIEDVCIDILSNINYENDLYNYISDKNIKKIIFIASGSSYNCAKIAKYYLEKQLNLQVDLYYSNDFVNQFNDKILNKNYLYIIISQGGQTIISIKALQIIKKNNVKNIAFTAFNDSEIAKKTDFHINIKCGNEKFVFRTIGVSTTLLNIYILGIIIAKIYKKVDINFELEFKNIKKSLLKINETIENIRIWFLTSNKVLKHKKSVFFVGANDLYGVCLEASIKFMEMVPIVTNFYEIEEFIHGPQNAFSNDITYFILNDFKDEEKTLKITRYLKYKFNDCIFVGDYKIDKNDIKLNLNKNYFDSFIFLTAFQVLAYYYAIENNRDLTKRINSDIDDFIKKQI